MSKVVVTADENGGVISVSENNPDYGWVRVEQTARVIDNTGWLNVRTRSALIKGKVADLQDADFKEGQELEGKIVAIESFIPFNQENPERDYKVAGDTAVVCTFNDQPIYRQTYYTPDETLKDQLIQHDNSHEIKGVQAARREHEGIKVKVKSEVAL